MADKAWKQAERKVADYFCTRRNPLSGGNSGHSRSDTLEPFLFIETKKRAKHAAVSLLDQTRTMAKKEIAPDGKPKKPVVALVENNRPGFYILIHSKDLDEVIGRSKTIREKILDIATNLFNGETD